MLNFQIEHVGCYRHDQVLQEHLPYEGICLSLSGVRRQFTFGRDWAKSVPHFLLAIKGEASDSLLGPNRENWVIIFRGVNLRHSAQPDLAEFKWNGRFVRIPLCVPISTEYIPAWRRELQAIQQAMKDPSPQSRMIAQLGVLSVLRYMMGRMERPAQTSPVYQFKNLIDADETFRQSLHELAAACGYSPDHLRILFQREFSIAPHDYINQRRVARALDLIASSHLSVKEISAQLGFQHVSAFSAMFRRLTGKSPRTAIRLHRMV